MTPDSKVSDVKPRKLTPAQTKMRDAVAYLKRYMGTYDEQQGYLDYSDRILIDDVLYGLGVALDRDKHTGATGYDEFRKRLREHLGMEARANQQPNAQWMTFDSKPVWGSRFLAWDGKQTCLFLAPKPGKDVSLEEAAEQMEKIVSVYRLSLWTRLPTPAELHASDERKGS